MPVMMTSSTVIGSAAQALEVYIIDSAVRQSRSIKHIDDDEGEKSAVLDTRKGECDASDPERLHKYCRFVLCSRSLNGMVLRIGCSVASAANIDEELVSSTHSENHQQI